MMWTVLRAGAVFQSLQSQVLLQDRYHRIAFASGGSLGWIFIANLLGFSNIAIKAADGHDKVWDAVLPLPDSRPVTMLVDEAERAAILELQEFASDKWMSEG